MSQNTNKYGFHVNKLTANEKKVYDAILKSCLKHQEFGNAWITKDVDGDKIFSALKYDNPGLFHVNFSVPIVYTATTYKISYLDYDFSKIEEIVKQIIEDVKEMDEYEKVLYVHDFLCNNAFYDFKAMDNFGKCNSNPMPFTIYGCLVEKLCVCEGFGLTFSYILNELNITNYITIGILNNDLPHCVNAVMINGLWCYIDVTCDCKDKQYTFIHKNENVYPIKHIAFGLSKEELSDIGYESDDLVVPTTDKYHYYKNRNWIYTSLPEIRRAINKMCNRKKIIKFRYDGKLDINVVQDRLGAILSGHGIRYSSIFIFSNKFISIIGGDLYEYKL